MRVSELAKELGYRAAELVELARARNLPLKTIRDKVDARKAALIRAQLPHRSKLDGEFKDLYDQVQKAIAEQEAEKKEAKKKAPARPRKPRKTPAAKKEKAPAAAAAAADPAAAAVPAKAEKPRTERKPKTVRKKKQVVEEFRLGAEAAKADQPRALPSLRDKEEKRERRPSAAPLIDVDKVIGEEKDVRAIRSSEIDMAERQKEQEKSKRAAPKLDTGRPRGRRVKGPPIARPTVQVKKQKQVVIPPTERDYTIQVPISMKDYSQKVGVKVNDLIREMMSLGQMAGMNAMLDGDTIEYLSEKFKRKVVVVREKKAEEVMAEEAKEEGRPEDLEPRPPVVTFLGHVDHGKTSLLDRIRNTDVVSGEAGGITQHVGASKIRTKDGKVVVFLDTPGHEAFTAMRARGAQATDLVVLVVAADDGVMPQTEEAFNHAKAAGVPIVVAINKVDKADANINKVKGQLANMGLASEDWGGKTSNVEVSALTGHNIDELVETIALEAELLELKSNPKIRARGVILEARKTEDRGVVATLLVQDGTLRKGDILLSGRSCGRVRSMQDYRGRAIQEAPPATPVEVAGLDEVPEVGDGFQVVADLKQAKTVVEERRKKLREAERSEQGKHVTLESLFSKIESGKIRDIKVVIKADAGGSMEVLRESLENLSGDEVKLNVLHTAVGSVSESDVLLADASDGIIVGFHVDVDPRADRLAKDKGVQIKLYKVIYEAIEEVKAALEGLLEPEKVQVRIGLLAVKEVFRISRVGAIAGCLVTDGKVERNASVRIVRNGKVVYEGRIESLKRFKDDVREVQEGYECGLKIAGHDDVRVGDVLEAMTIQEIARKLEKKG